MERYRFTRTKEESASDKPEQMISADVALSIVGSSKESAEHNQEKYGEYLAERIAAAINNAKKSGKKLVFDMATGSTPKAAWPKFNEMADKGNVAMDNVIVMGHEEAWGTFQKGSKSDFDAYRRNFLTENHQSVSEIRTIDQVSGAEISGNFIPMHLQEADRNDFPEGDEGIKLFRQAESQAAAESAQQYGQLIDSIQKRDDVYTLGLYGVGTDGHIGEVQISAMGKEATKDRRSFYADSLENYSVEHGLFYWQKDTPQGKDDEFHPDNNVFWKRGAAEGEAVGRAVWQGYADIHEGVGIGWKEMLREDEIVLAFNNESKQLAFQLAMEGSLDGSITSDSSGESVMDIERDKGEGENVLPDLEAFALSLEDEGVLEAGAVERNKHDNGQSHGLFKAIYEALNKKEYVAEDPEYKELWKFVNRYIGKRAPVSRLIRMRALLGKKTELVVTPEVVKGTNFEKLAQ